MHSLVPRVSLIPTYMIAGTGNAFGTYLADVVEHFRNQGINIRYISPINEPDNDFGPVPCGQEGMKVAPNQCVEFPSESLDPLN